MAAALERRLEERVFMFDSLGDAPPEVREHYRGLFRTALAEIRAFDVERGPSDAEFNAVMGWITENPGEGYVDLDDARIHDTTIKTALNDAAKVRADEAAS